MANSSFCERIKNTAGRDFPARFFFEKKRQNLNLPLDPVYKKSLIKTGTNKHD